VYLIDDLPTHPKILRAGALIGGDHGPAIALTIYISAIAYARKHATDGFIPRSFLVSGWGEGLANLVTAKIVGLFSRVPGGYLIHDFHDYNRTAKETKQIRAQTRDRVAKWRARNAGKTHE
jgi:hypothetical protein